MGDCKIKSVKRKVESLIAEFPEEWGSGAKPFKMIFCQFNVINHYEVLQKEHRRVVTKPVTH